MKLPWQRKGIKLTSAERLARQVGKNRSGGGEGKAEVEEHKDL